MNIFAFIEFRTIAEAQAAQVAQVRCPLEYIASTLNTNGLEQLTVLGVPLRIEAKRYTTRRNARSNMNHSPVTFTNIAYKSPYQSPAYHTNDNRNHYNNSYSAVFNPGPSVGFTASQSPHVPLMRGGPPSQFGNSSNMSPYTQYPSPHYSSPLAPRGYDMSSPAPMYHGGPPPAPPYYGPYMVGGAGGYNVGGPGAMQPIPEQEGETGASSGGF